MRETNQYYYYFNFHVCRTNELYKQADDDQKSELNEFLRQVLAPKFSRSPIMANFVAGAFYDRGLFYRTVEGAYRCISGPARNALLPSLSKALREKRSPVFSSSVCKICLKSIFSRYSCHICDNTSSTAISSLFLPIDYRIQRKEASFLKVGTFHDLSVERQ